MSRALKRFVVRAEATVSIECEVMARSAASARAMAADMPEPGLCHQCRGGDPRERWVLTGGFDGVAKILRGSAGIEEVDRG